MRVLKIGLLSASLIGALSNQVLADCGCGAPQAPERKFYIGMEGGMSMPLKHSFDIKDKETNSTARAKLNNSKMYGAIVGYKFYPDMAFEFGFQRKPMYKAKVTTQAASKPTPIPGVLANVPSASNTVKITSDLYLMGISYHLSPLGAFTPYIGFDAGIARVKARGVTISAIPTMLGMSLPISEVMEIKKTSCIAPAWQLTLGVNTPDLIPNTQVYLATRLQAIHNVKLKYSVAGGETKTFKKTLGVGEVVLGMTYDLPF